MGAAESREKGRGEAAQAWKALTCQGCCRGVGSTTQVPQRDDPADMTAPVIPLSEETRSAVTPRESRLTDIREYVALPRAADTASATSQPRRVTIKGSRRRGLSPERVGARGHMPVSNPSERASEGTNPHDDDADPKAMLSTFLHPTVDADDRARSESKPWHAAPLSACFSLVSVWSLKTHSFDCGTQSMMDWMVHCGFRD